MYLKSIELFLGMGKTYVKEVMDISTKLFKTKGDCLFHQGDPANFFYLLLSGKVKLNSGKTGPVQYVEKRPGKIIGLSSLAVRGFYSATAECVEPTSLLKFDRERFLMILRKNSQNQAILQKRLAEIDIAIHFKTFSERSKNIHFGTGH